MFAVVGKFWRISSAFAVLATLCGLNLKLVAHCDKLCGCCGPPQIAYRDCGGDPQGCRVSLCPGHTSQGCGYSDNYNDVCTGVFLCLDC